MEIKKEQQQIINHEQGNLLVSASAGSGKTFVMINRLIRLITEQKASVDSVLAITFTEKASQEIKDRIAVKLIEEIQNGKAILKSQLLALPSADITTIDSFCSRLVRRYFFEVGVSADFGILDEENAEIIRNEIIDELFEEKYAERNADFLYLTKLFSVKRKDDNLKNLVKTLHSKFATESDYNKIPNLTYFNDSKEGLQSIKKAYENSLIENLNSALILLEKENGLAQNLAKFNQIGMANVCYGIRDFILDVIKLGVSESKCLIDTVTVSAKGERAKIDDDEYNKYKSDYFKVIAIFKDYKEKVNEFLSCPDSEIESKCLNGIHIAKKLIDLVFEYRKRYANEKLQQGVLDFNDLEYYALQLLLKEDIQKSVSSKYKYVFVDEYQDVNGMQDKIISLIQKDNLFMVGDVKQGIYSFRGCDSSLFLEKESLYKNNQGGTFVPLNYNFRSSNKVIDFVNQIFNYSMLKQNSAVDYYNDAQLVGDSGYSNFNNDETVLHVVDKLEVESQNYDDVYDIIKESKIFGRGDFSEEKVVAKIILEAVNNKKWYDAKTQQEKNIEFKDIVILLRGMSSANKLITVLNSCGIPVSGSERVTLQNYPEVKNVYFLLSLLDCFNQDLPLVAVLKTFFNITDKELNAVRNESCCKNYFYQAFLEYIKTKTPLAKKLGDIYSYISSMRKKADFIGAGDILNQIMQKTHYKQKLLLDTMGESKVNRVDVFVSGAYQNGTPLTIKEFLQKVDHESKKSAKIEVEENAVKVMTMHSSKGLEFPFVIIPYVDKALNSEDTKQNVLVSSKYGVVSKWFNVDNMKKGDSILFELIKNEIKKENITSELYLFYVALTRAKCHLHLVSKKTPQEIVKSISNSMLKFIPPNFKYVTEKLVEEQTKLQPNREIILANANEEYKKVIKNNLSFTYAYSTDCNLPLKTSVTKTLNFNEPEQNVKYVFTDSESNKELGILAHKIMEKIDFYKPFDSQIQSLIKSGIIKEEGLQKLNLQALKNILTNNIFNEVKDYQKYTEQEFIAQIPANLMFDGGSENKILLQGIIDLLCVKNGSAIILDYKYSKKDGETLKQDYQKQLKLYSYAVETVLTLKVEKTYIVNLLSGEVINI